MNSGKHIQPDDTTGPRHVHVLTRTEGEGIAIGEDIEVCVLLVEGNDVRIAIQAPRRTRLSRTTFYENADERHEGEPCS